MRVRQLDLIRYGRFTDYTLDFGAGDGETDVTLVYGENEAGKSTAYAAWLDLLFGLPNKHPYDFLHSRKDLMIGATLDTAEGSMTLRRTGQKTGSLTDDNGRVIDERRLELLLHGLDREEYRTRFSLDDEVLRDGGAEIAQAKGDLGQLLHAGSSGLSGFAEVLDQAQNEVVAFHKPRGRTTVLADAKRELTEIEVAMREASLDPRRYDELRHAAQAAEEAFRRADAARNEAKRVLAMRERADERRALAGQIIGIRTELDAYPDGPDLPPEAVTEVSLAAEAIARAKAAQTLAASKIQAADDHLDALSPDVEGQRLADLLADLEAAKFDDGKSLVTRASAAAADLDRRRAARDAARVTAQGLADRLAGVGSDPSRIVVPRDVRLGLLNAARGVREAEHARDAARRQLAQAKVQLGEVEELPAGTDALADALAALDKLPQDLAQMAQTQRDLSQAAGRAAAGLPANWRDIADAGLPSDAELRVAERALAKAQGEVEQAAGRAREAEEELAEREAARDAEVQVGRVVPEPEIAESRKERDRLWVQHRSVLDAATAEAFEAAMQRDDELRDRFGKSAEGRARVAQLDADIARLRETTKRRRADLREAEAALEAPQAAVRKLSIRLGLDPTADPGIHSDRLAKLQGALEGTLAAEHGAAALKEARHDRDQALKRVIAAHAGITGETLSGEEALPPARRLLENLEARKARIASRDQAARLAESLAQDCQAQDLAVAAAQADLDRQKAELWCADHTVAQILSIAGDLETLEDHVREFRELEGRIARLEDALAAFDTRSAPVREILDLSPDIPVPDLLRRARQRSDTAAETARQIAQTQRDRSDAIADRDRQAQMIATSTHVIQTILTGQVAYEGEDPVTTVRRLNQRDGLRRDLRQREAEHAAKAEGVDPEALEAEEADADPLRTEMLKEEVAEAEAARDQALGQRGQAQQALDAALHGSGGSAHAQSRAAVLEGLREQARRAAATEIGLMAARGALRRLREDRRGPMLKATEAAFSRMTEGEWQRLEAQPSSRGERLVGIRGGAALAADAMSTGTRGQLYLALRVAGHADFVERYGPLPFITDDILETFDDARASAALQLTAEMGRVGQAIMFTHHRHLVDLARDAIPGVQVVELD